MTSLFLTLTLLAAVPAPAAPTAPPAEATQGPRTGALDPQFVAGLVGAPAGTKLSGEALDHRTAEVAALVRCPVCQGSSVADSPSDTARNMKREIHDLLAMGFDQEQILHYFELSYGEFIRLQPETHGINALVWAGPGLALLLGLGLVLAAVRRLTGGKSQKSTAPPGRGELPEDLRLAAAVRRVRELAYGWPGGEPPGEA